MDDVTGAAELTRRTVLREGAVAFPAWWPRRPRSALLAAMAAVTAEHGFGQVRVDDVTGLARGSRRTFYACFDDRQDCLLAAHEAAVRDCLMAIDGSGGDPRVALARLMAYLAAWPTHSHLLLVGILGAGPVGLQRHEVAMGDLGRRLAACAKPSCPSGAVADEDVADARLGALHRLVALRVAAGRHGTLPLLTPVLLQLVDPTCKT